MNSQDAGADGALVAMILQGMRASRGREAAVDFAEMMVTAAISIVAKERGACAAGARSRRRSDRAGGPMTTIPRRVGRRLGGAKNVRPNEPMRRALAQLAAAPDGVAEAVLLAHGVTVADMVELIRAGLATASAERVVAGRRATEIARSHA